MSELAGELPRAEREGIFGTTLEERREQIAQEVGDQALKEEDATAEQPGSQWQPEQEYMD